MTKLQVAKKLLQQRAARFPDVFPELNVGLYTYTPPSSLLPDSKGYRVFYKMQPFNKDAFIKAVDSLPEEASGPTLLQNALRQLDKLLEKLSGRTVVFLFTDGGYNEYEAEKKPLVLARELAEKYDVSFQIISTTTIKKQKEIMEAVASINSSSRVYPIEALLSHPEAYSGAVFVLEESYIIAAETREEVVGLKLDNILFDFDGTGIKMEFNDELNDAGSILQNKPDSYIVLAGFTDNRGDEEYNLALSRRRVEAVADYLANDFQIDKSRVAFFWYGEAARVAYNDTVDGRQKNRRVLGFISRAN
jgi:OOP family OmpA-OmpF porin